jgi:glutaminase
MSYIQIEIGGKPRGLKFNKMAQLTLQEKIIPGNLMSGAYGLIYGGLIANCYVKGEEPEFTFEDACDWTDQLSDETILKVQAAFQETEAYKKGQAYLAEVEAAKKKEVPKDKPLKNTKQKV